MNTISLWPDTAYSLSPLALTFSAERRTVTWQLLETVSSPAVAFTVTV